MARYIDADELTAVIQKKLNENQGKKGTFGYSALETFTEILQMMPAVDVVPLVRCKECEYASPSTFPTAGKEWLSCQYGIKTIAVKATHFCSYGRKKDEITKTTDS